MLASKHMAYVQGTLHAVQGWCKLTWLQVWHAAELVFLIYA